MRLVEKLVPRSYHLLDYDWTPLSQNPYWIAVLLTASIVTWGDTGVCRQASEQSAVVQILPGTRISFPGSGGDTSFADDLVASRYCKCWEWACLTIRWDFTWVLMMCQAKKNKTPQKERCMFFCLKIVLHSVSGKRTLGNSTLDSIWDALSDVHSLLITISKTIQCGENPHPTN